MIVKQLSETEWLDFNVLHPISDNSISWHDPSQTWLRISSTICVSSCDYLISIIEYSHCKLQPHYRTPIIPKMVFIFSINNSHISHNVICSSYLTRYNWYGLSMNTWIWIDLYSTSVINKWIWLFHQQSRYNSNWPKVE